MSFLAELPSASYPVKIGDSFSGHKKKEISTIRYDFMPASIDQSDKYVVQDGEKHDQIAVVVPKIDQGAVSSKDSTIFKGQKKPCKGKDCLLLFNHDTQQFTLEMLSSNISLKQTRGDTTQLTEAVQKHIDSTQDTKDEDSNSDSGSDHGLMSSSSSNESEDDSDDDAAKALEAATATTAPPVAEQKKQPVSQLHSDLHLSDSSDDEN